MELNDPKKHVCVSWSKECESRRHESPPYNSQHLQGLANKSGSEMNVCPKYICCKIIKNGNCDVARLMMFFKIIYEVTLMQDV